ncbi:MAG: hypothetical protein HZC24_11485 [Rhodocyclales bacterium]|nr:hypothetical protein [Rhodocyclales bacterium]
MRVATGTVVGGKVVLNGDSFAEGAIVTILARDDDETFVASPEQEAELLSAIAEIESGDCISPEQLFERLRRLT